MNKRRMYCIWMVAMLCMVCMSAQAQTLLWNELNGEAYGATVGAHAFAEKLSQLSGGSMEIDLYINGDLGSEAESMQGIQWGTLDIFRGNASSLPNYGAEKIGATGLPYVFTDMEQFHDFAISDLGQELLDSVEQADCGYIALAWLVEGPRSIFITEKAYKAIGSPKAMTLDLMKGLIIRIPDTKLMNKTMEALGSIPTPVTYSEVNRSLQSGNIDGAENGVTTYISEKFYQYAPYFITDAHTFGCGVILVSSETWNQLGDEQKSWMREAGKAASEACYAYNQKQEQDCFNAFAKEGILLLPVADIEDWQDACEGLYSEQPEEIQELIHRIQNHDY